MRREQRRLDALQLLRAFVDLLLDQAAERLDDGVGEQDAEEGADQRRADHAAEDRRRLADRAHRVDHAEHRRDDAERRQRAGEPAERVDRPVRLGVMGLDLAVHQALDLVRVEVARDHHAQVVGDELDDVVVGADDGVLLEQRRAGRILDVLLDRHQAFLARLLQDVVEQRHQLHVARLRVLRALQHARDRGEGRLQHLGLVVDREGAERAAQDRHQLGRQGVQDHADVAAMDDVGAEDAPHRDGVTDQNDHGC